MGKAASILAGIVISLFVLGTAFAGKNVVLATLDWEPYVGHTLVNKGYAAEVVTEAYKRAGYRVEIIFLPWARVVNMARKGYYDGYFPEYFSDTLAAYFEVSSPFPGGPLVLFKRKGEKIDYSSLKDLKPYRIGVVRGYINTAEFDSADYLKKDPAKDDLTNFKKLLKNRVDLVVADKLVGYYVVQKNIPGLVGMIDVVSPPMEEKNLYLCISKLAVDYREKIAAMEKGLSEIKNDGTLVRIMNAHGFTHPISGN